MSALEIFTAEENEKSLLKFVDFIKIPSVSGSGPMDGSYDRCAEWLMTELKDMGLDCFILKESLPNKPIVIGKWTGEEPDLPCILLNSHYDVVPVLEEYWTVPAFEGLRVNQRVYGRGTQDMKCVCVQYLVALRKLKATGFKPRRTIYLSYVPDEEIGGQGGMNVLTASDWFSEVTIDLALDEGLASEDDDYSLFYGERLPWWVRLKATGNTGHGSRFIEGTAVEQIIGVANKALEFRQGQKDLLHGKGSHAGCSHAVMAKKKKTLGDVTSLNVTMLQAGVVTNGENAINVVPPTAELGMDIRVSPHLDTEDMKKTLDLWCEEVSQSTHGLKEGDGVKWEFFYPPVMEHALTSTDPTKNPWFSLFSSVITEEIGANIIPGVFPAATDSRFLRVLGVKAFGFSPMRRSPILLHEHDEYLEESVYLEGCRVYVALLRKLSSQGPI